MWTGSTRNMLLGCHPSVNGRTALSSDPMLGERLARARKRAGLKQVELAVALGDRYDHTVISAVEHNRSSLRLDGAVAAARTLGVSLDYLAGLTEDRTPAVELAARLGAAEAAVTHAAVLRPDYSPVQLVTGGAVGGGAEGDADHARVDGYVPFRNDWLARHGLDPRRCSVIAVTGKSMEPGIQDGAVILVDHQRTRRRRDRVFVVATPDGELVKRARRGADGWWLVSDHADQDRYPPMPWPAGAAVRGQVMWTGRTL